MNLTIDLKSITDVDSDRSSNDIDSYDSAERCKKEKERNGEGEKEGERGVGGRGNEDENNQEEVEDEAVDEEEDEYELRENLDSYGSDDYDNYSCSLRGGYLYDYDRYYSAAYSGEVNYKDEEEEEEEEKYCLFKGCEFRMRHASRRGRRRNEDMVCFYVNAVANSNDLVKYFRPGCRVPEDDDCWLCNYRLSVTESKLKKLTLKEDKDNEKSSGMVFCKAKFKPCEREFCPIQLNSGRNTCRSFSFTSNWCCYDNHFPPFSYRSKQLVNSKRNGRSRHPIDRGSDPLALELCSCPSTSGRRVPTGSSQLDDYAASLASAARSARNLARDLDHLLTTLGSEDAG